MLTLFRNIVLVGVMALAACDSAHLYQSEPSPPMGAGELLIPVPLAIRQAAAINSTPLEIQIKLNDSIARVVPITNLDEPIREIINVPVDQNNKVDLAWYAIVGSKKVLLADFTKTVEAGDNVLDVNSYNSVGPAFDEDGDGRSNLVEARENRNMLGEYDLEVPFRTTFGGIYGSIIDDGVDIDLSGDIVEQDAATPFSLRHDGTNLIVYVCGSDRTLDEGDGDGINANGVFQYWHDDTVFVFLDGNNSGGNSYDNIDDFQLGFHRQSGEMYVAQGRNNSACPNAECITHRFFPEVINTACAYEFEAFLPLAELNMTVGSTSGFDIELTDDDNGGKRDTSGGWIGYDDASNEKPGTFGSIILR